MKKHQLIANVLGLSTILAASCSVFAATSCGANYDPFFTVRGKDLEVVFCDRGASIYSIKYKDKYITYHPKEKDIFLQDNNYYGKALGRIAGRVKDGKLNWEGHEYQLEVNEQTTTKNNSLHGGTHSFTAQNFERKIADETNRWDISFHYVSSPMEAGYPESVDTTYTYSVYKQENKVDLNISATTSGSTPLNLTTHPYFRLGNSGDILFHKLTIPASKRAEYANEATKTTDQVVVGTKNVAGTPWDFRAGKKIGQDIEAARDADPISGGYDHIWKFDDTANNIHTITLLNPLNHVKLSVDTDADGVIMYANCFAKDQEMNPCGLDATYGGITIEPYKFFTKDSIADLKVAKGEEFTRYISYKLSEENV